MNILKNKPLLILIVIAGIVLAAAVFLLTKKPEPQSSLIPPEEQQNVKKVSPEEIGLDLSLSPDKKSVVMKITELAGIASVEYEISYNALVIDEGETVDVPRGVVASPIEVEEGDEEIEKEILLGTCSANKCKYDKITSDIKFIIKINYKNGEIGAVEAALPFEE